MLNRVKQFFGIEGVKIEILPLAEDALRPDELHGHLRFSTMHAQTVEEVSVRLVEKYARGRGKERLVDEYELGRIALRRPFEVPADAPVTIRFVLPYTRLKSEVDSLGERNVLLGGFASALKALRGVQSTFRLEAVAKVRGTALDPVASLSLEL